MTWYYIVILMLVAFIGGYITKDMLTVEKKIEVTIKNPKVRGRGNTMTIDADVEVEEKKERRKLFGKRKK